MGGLTYNECLAISPEVITNLDSYNVQCGTPTTDIVNWRKAQHQDKMIADWITAVKDGEKPRKGDRALRKYFDHVHLIDGLLYRVMHSDGEMKKQLILPAPLIPDILQSFHTDVGHDGKDRTLSLS
jgi:hypothetical protein